VDDLLKNRPPYNQVRLMAWKEDGLNAEERTASGWASTPAVDSYGEVVKPVAFTDSLQSYLRNPVMFWNHSWYDVPIGRCLDASIHVEDGLWIKALFGTTVKAEEVWKAVSVDKTVRSMSIGFRGDYSPEFGYYDKEQEAWIWTNLKLVEISVVGMPACAEAQFQLSKSLGLPMFRGYRSLEMDVDMREREWDSREADGRIRRWAQTETSRQGCYLLNSELPIADIVDGKPKLAWSGVACAMVRLLGGKGGVDTSQESKAHALSILRQAYAKCGKRMPEWTGEWPASLKDIQFVSGEMDFLEQSVIAENMRTCLQSSQSVANGARHWAKRDRGLSDEVRQSAVRSISELADSLSATEYGQMTEEMQSSLTGACGKLQALTQGKSNNIIRIV
jgi:HK97 family phage prohead protease